VFSSYQVFTKFVNARKYYFGENLAKDNPTADVVIGQQAAYITP